MFKKIFTLFLILFLCSNVISAGVYNPDPASYIITKTYLVESGELVKNYIEVTHSGTEYYVLPIYGFGDEVLGFIVLEKEKEKLVEKDITLKKLIETVDLIIEYNDLKKEINNNVSLTWFFAENRTASRIADKIVQEQNDLSLIQSQMNSSDVDEIIIELNNRLDAIATSLEILSLDMIDVSNAENELISSPETGEPDNLKKEIQNVFSVLYEIESQTNEYDFELQKLKAIISSADSSIIDLDSKRSLLSLANLPPDYDLIGQWISQSASIENAIDSIYSTVSSRSNDWAKAFKTRIQKAKAFKEIYGTDEELIKLNSKSYTLENAVEIILNKSNITKWELQEEVNYLTTQWNKTLSYYKQAEYGNAIDSAQKAKESAKKIYKEGVKVIENKSEIRIDLLIGGLAIIIVLIAIIYAVRNREKIGNLTNNNEYEEVELSDWKK